MAKLRKFDTLIEEEHHVSFFDFFYLDVQAFNENTFKQLPWEKTQFIITSPSTIYLFDSVTGRVTEQFKFEELIPDSARVLFDRQNRKVGLLIAGELRLFQYTEGRLRHQHNLAVTFTPKELQEQIYGDNYIYWDYNNKLYWRSLTTNTIVKELIIYGEETFVARSAVEPVLYFAAVSRERSTYLVWKIDCTLQREETKTLLYEREWEAEICCQGMEGFKLIENESGRCVQIAQIGDCDQAFNVYDLDTGRLTSLHNDDRSNDFNCAEIEINQSALFYCFVEEDTLVIRDVKADYEEKKDNKPRDQEDLDDEMTIEYSTDDLIEDAYYSREFDYGLAPNSCTWLNDDILTFKIFKRSPTNKRITSRVFFSVAKLRVIGTIDDQIVELFMNDNYIIAFHSSGSVYRIALNPSYKTTKDNVEFDEDAVLRENMSIKKRKRDRFDGYEADFEPPSRKRLRSSLAEEIKK